jgi:hypothetical protein
VPPDMKKEYDLSKLKKVGRGPVANPKATKVQTSIRLDGDVMAWAQSETPSNEPFSTIIV